VILLSLTMKNRGDGMELAVTYSYSGKLPDKRKRRKIAADALRCALEAVEKNTQTDIGFAEDDRSRIRRDHYLTPTREV
jgi:hypothetical protein